MILIIIILILVFACYLMATNVAYTNGKEYYGSTNFVLPDIGFNLINDQRDSPILYKVKELLCIGFLIIFLISIYGNKKAIYEYFITIGIILFLKNILFSATTLPDPSQKCNKFNIFSPHKGSCYDLIISTHTTLIFVALLVIVINHLYSLSNTFMVVFINVIIMYLIIALRQHYTIDIINALVYGFLIHHIVSNEIVQLFL